MTRVCLVGEDGCTLQYELLSRETAREALMSYDLQEPFANSVAVETVSLGAAVSLINDLDWYLVRFVSDVLVQEPSVSEEEWLSRKLATTIRNDEIAPAETGRLLKVYGLVHPATAGEDVPTPTTGQQTNDDDTSDEGEGTAGDPTAGQSRPTSESRYPGPMKLVDPMLVARTGDRVPEYDLRDVLDTVVVRVTESEFEA